MPRKETMDEDPDFGTELPQHVRSSSLLSGVTVPRNPTTKKFLPGYMGSVMGSSHLVDRKMNEMVRGRALVLSKERSKADREKVLRYQGILKRKEDLPKKAQGMNAREKRRRGTYRIPKKGITYDSVEPMHTLWKGYMAELKGTGQVGGPAFAMKLLKADFHGAILRVSRSRSPLHVGLQGIVLQETKNMFRLVTQENRILSIPKQHSAFVVPIHGQDFEILGDHFRHAPSERSTRKVKPRPTVDL